MRRPTTVWGFFFGAALILSACGLVGGGEDEADGEDIEAWVHWGDDSRKYLLHLPPALDATQPAPLVLAFHGSRSTPTQMQEGTAFDEAGNEQGFITAYPNSQVGNWAEGCGCNNADRLEVDDLGLVHALIDTLSAQYTVDPKRIYAVGFSQGGLFAQRLACEVSDRLAAVAVVAATMSVPLSRTCEPAEPVSMLMIHGTEDSVLPWSGTNSGALSLLSMPETTQLWRQHNACPVIASEVNEKRIGPGRSIIYWTFAPCEGGTQVRRIDIEGGRHEWPRDDVDASTIVAAFFAHQVKR